MGITPLHFDLTQDNDKFFPGRFGARKQIDINLKKFIPLPRLFLRKRMNTSLKHNDTKKKKSKK